MWVIGVSRLFNVGSKYYTLCPYRAARAARARAASFFHRSHGDGRGSSQQRPLRERLTLGSPTHDRPIESSNLRAGWTPRRCGPATRPTRAPAHGCPQWRYHTRTRQRDTKHTAVHALYCSMCLAVLRIPTCAPTELPPPNVHCLCPNPLASAGRCGHPHHSASCEIVHHR